jgi:PAT family beta-lactamase induction signal transducer AmpG
MGLANMTFGFYGGFIVLPLPQMLAARHVPELQIAAITSLAFSPGFWVFLLGPMLDVRFSRRWYATVFAVLAGLSLTGAMLVQQHLRWLAIVLTLGYTFAVLSANALGGWLASIVEQKDEASLSSWNQVASFLGNGLIALIAGEMLQRFPVAVSSSILGAMVAAPALIFLFMPAPGPDRRLARESFTQFFAEILQLFKRREVLLALLLFTAPTACFALTNTLGGLGGDFHATPRFVSVVGGIGLSIVGSVACLLFQPIARVMRSLYAYLAIGVAGGAFTLTMLLLPRTPLVFAIAFLGENAFQALAFTAGVAITFEAIGRNNPLAATQFGLLTSATVVPILYMQLVDGHAYTHFHLHGTYLIDGGISVVACALCWLALRRFGGALLRTA